MKILQFSSKIQYQWKTEVQNINSVCAMAPKKVDMCGSKNLKE